MQQSLDKAESLYNDKRYRDAERIYAKLVRHLDTGGPVWCDTRYKQGRALLQDRERTRGAPVMREVADKCARVDRDMRTWARYYAARAYGRIGRWDESIRQFEKLEAEAPDHSLADDASYRAALAELENGRQKASVLRLSSIPKLYPDGDMWPRALFKLGWLQLREGKYQGAYDRFDELVKRGGDERQEGITGRANYWRAQALYRMGRRIDAAMPTKRSSSDGRFVTTRNRRFGVSAKSSRSEPRPWCRRCGQVTNRRAWSLLGATSSPSRPSTAWSSSYSSMKSPTPPPRCRPFTCSATTSTPRWRSSAPFCFSMQAPRRS